MKLCKDCRHCRGVNISSDGKTDLSHCAHPEVMKPGEMSLTTGQRLNDDYGWCSILRSNGAKCGPDGKLFAPQLAVA